MSAVAGSEGSPPSVRRLGLRRRPGPVVLWCHGGHLDDPRRTKPWDLAYLRVLWLAVDCAIRQRRLAQMYVLRYADRGWNDGKRVTDTGWAIEEVRRRSGSDGVALVGHSMGGRATLLTAAERDDVTVVVALATWIKEADAATLARITCPVRLAHGTADTVTAPASSEFVATTITAAGGDATYTPVNGENHSLTRYPMRWARIVGAALAGHLDSR